MNDKSIEDIVLCTGDWFETTTRKNKHKICRDIFIAATKGRRELCMVKNGKLVGRRCLTSEECTKIVCYYGLELVMSDVFRNCGTYRTPQSNNLVKWLLRLKGKTF